MAEPTEPANEVWTDRVEPGASLWEAIWTRGLSRTMAIANPILLGILALAALLRLWDVDWDQDAHLHPDERFLTMVGNAMQIPSGVGQYLNPATSHLNPANIGFQFYVYGTFPLILNRFVAALLNTDTYNTYTIQGRVLSAIADLLVVLLVYKIAELFERELGLSDRIKYLAAVFYAVAVLPIQLSHFFAVDTFLSLFMIAAFYFALRFSYRPGAVDAGLSAVCFGLAMGSKITAVYIAPLVGVFLLLPLLKRAGYSWTSPETSFQSVLRAGDLKRLAGDVIPLALLYAVIAYLVLRFADPYMFQSGNILDPQPSSLFINNLRQVAAEANPSSTFPPSLQWLSKTPMVFALVNVAIFGLGVPLFLLAVLGMYLANVRSFYSRLTLLQAWMLLVFLYESVQFADTMRYFIFLYPFLALFAALGFHALADSIRPTLKVALFVPVLIWPIAFMNIYTHPISRVTASNWMYRALPNGSVVLSEEWDDPLPVGTADTYGKTFTGGTLHVFYPDLNPDGTLNQAKWTGMEQELRRGDYLVLSSNRGWGSMPTIPQKYPMITRYYHDLFAGRPLPGGTRYREIAEFTDYPSLRYLGVPIDFPDQWAEEAFTVYDHPKVMIFEHVR